MNSRAAKIKQLKELIKGEKAPRNVKIVLKRNDAGQVVVLESKLLSEGIPVSIIYSIVSNRDDVQFWETFDTSEIVEKEIQKLNANSRTSGKVMNIKTLSQQSAELITNMYENDSKRVSH